MPSPAAQEAKRHMWHLKWKENCTLPVTSCEYERSISGLRRVETYLRITVTEERRYGLLLTHINYDMELNIDSIIDDFV